MRQYEVMAIIDPDVDERQIQPIIDKYSKVITDAKGTVDATDIMGRRRLAYPINKKTDGIYVVFNISSEPAAVAEMDRLMTIDEQFMRTKVMRTDTKKVRPEISADRIEVPPERDPRTERGGGRRSRDDRR